MEAAAFSLNGVSFTYPTATAPAIDIHALSFEAGSFNVICGASGSGKSTLLRTLKPTLTPHGKLTGEVLFFGESTNSLTPRDDAVNIGFVMQSPEDQVVCDKVWHELAFGLESIGRDSEYIRRRVAEMAAFFGIENWFYKNVSELSGGQKQLLSLASVMVMDPKVLLLDEPTSRLDPIAAEELLSAVARINRELGTTVIMTEHRLEEALPLATSMVVMDHGRAAAAGTVADVAGELRASGHEIFAAMPAAMRIWAGLDADGACPMSVSEGAAMIDRFAAASPPLPVPRKPRPTGETAIEAKGVFFRYEEGGPDILRGFDFTLRRGEISALLGGNGAGKTTALRVLAGLRRPTRGEVTTAAKISYLPQEPQILFVKKTVREELAYTLAGAGVPASEREARIIRMAHTCGITELLDSHPFDLSGGELQRAATAKVLLLSPDVLLLDEPTKGLDAAFKRDFGVLLRSLAAAGMAILIVSHDVEFCAEFADTCSLFFDGSVASSGSAAEFFSGNSFYTTAAARMARRSVPGAVTVCAVLAAFGCAYDDSTTEVSAADLPSADAVAAEKQKNRLPLWRRIVAAISITLALGIFVYIAGISDLTKLITSGGISAAAAGQLWLTSALIALLIIAVMSLGRRSKEPEFTEVPKELRHLSRRTVAAAVMILAAIPVTLFFGIYYLGDRSYGAISIAVLLECMLPFFLVFEGRRPMARELVVIAVLCAIGVAGRAVFFMLPQFKPVMAIVIISGVAFGGETGFMVGAVTMLVSNLLAGQGPWTPWQMFAMGIIGFIAGVLFRYGILRRTRGSLAIFGALAAIVVYGGIMNPASVLIWSPASISWKTVLASYVSGLPMDLIHAAATVFFLLAAAEPMLEKLDRIKLKYGLVEPHMN